MSLQTNVASNQSIYSWTGYFFKSTAKDLNLDTFGPDITKVKLHQFGRCWTITHHQKLTGDSARDHKKKVVEDYRDG